MKLIPAPIANKFARTALHTQKHAPTLLFGGGVVGVVASTVLACRATLKLEEVLHEASNNLEIARGLESPQYSDQDRKKDVAIIYTQSAVSVAKLYAPAIVLGGVSIAALTSSHNMLNRRNAALTAAYAAVEKGFREYRERVVDKYGEDADRELRFPTEKITEINPETGRNHTVVHVAGDEPSIYARFFDAYSTSWSKEPEYNMLFLRNQQNYANDMLKARGHLFLNEVYDMLGIERSSAGSVVGWVISEEGDNYVDFGIFSGNTDNARNFIHGREGSVLCDFNVDGVIYDKLGNNSKEKIAWQK